MVGIGNILPKTELPDTGVGAVHGEHEGTVVRVHLIVHVIVHVNEHDRVAVWRTKSNVSASRMMMMK